MKGSPWWMSEPVVVVKAAKEPLTIEDAKEHLRIDQHDEDVWLLAAIQGVTARAEAMLGRALITQSLEVALDAWPGTAVHLPRPPLQSVTWIKYYDENGVEATVSSSDYLVDTRRGRVLLKSSKSWPGTGAALREASGVVIRYVAGYGDDPDDLPADILPALKLWLGELYEVRENSAAGGLVTVPNAAEKLLLKHRVW